VFIFSESGVGGRFAPAVLAVVHVPETTVNEDYFFVAG
jgi:hypothetical protein